MRLYLYAAVALALIGLGLYAKHQHDRAAKLQARAESAEASVIAERKARRHEKEIADAASNQFQSTVSSLQDELSKRPLRPVVIRVPVSTMPQAGSTARAPSGSDAQTEGRDHREAEKDIGPELTNYMLDCQINTLQLESLQSWVKSR